MNVPHPTRRRQMAAALLALAAPLAAWAQPSFPSKPITLIVPFPPGGATDTQFRALGVAAGKLLKQTVVVVNQPGAAGTMAPANMARSAAPDGYTLAVIASSVYRVPHLQKVSYDVNTDFSFVAGISEFVFGIAVAANSPFKTAQDFVAAAKARPGQLNVGSISNGSSGHVALFRWGKLAGFETTFVPYKGASEVIQAVLGGQLDAMSEASWVPLAQQGKLRPLAVYAESRNPALPQVPTLKELGWNVVTKSTVGIAGPKGMEPQVVAVLEEAFKAAMADPDFKRTLEMNGQGPGFMDSATYTRFVKEQFQAEKRNIDDLKAAGVPLND